MAKKSAAEEIVAAVQLMDVADNELWEADGAPKLDAVRTLAGNDKLTAEDVAAATNGFKRPVPPAVQSAAKVPSADADKPDLLTLPEAAPSQADIDAKLVEEARVGLAAAEAEIAAINEERGELNKRLDVVIAAKDVHAKLIERLGPRVTFAEGVKRIQEQTVKRLADIKESSALAKAALQATGTNIYPSLLDASFGNRKRTPEQQANMAKYVHQSAARASEFRG